MTDNEGTKDFGIEQQPQRYREKITAAVIYLTETQCALEGYLEMRRGAAFSDVYRDFMEAFRQTFNFSQPVLKRLKGTSEYAQMLTEVTAYLEPDYDQKMWNRYSDTGRINRAVLGVKLSTQFRCFLGTVGLISLD